jgi:hypothetical protein
MAILLYDRYTDDYKRIIEIVNKSFFDLNHKRPIYDLILHQSPQLRAAGFDINSDSYLTLNRNAETKLIKNDILVYQNDNF